MMIGRLNASVAGRPIIIEGVGGRIVVHVKSYRDAWFLRRSVSTLVVPSLATATRVGLGVEVSVSGQKSISLAPNPGWIIRFLLR